MGRHAALETWTGDQWESLRGCVHLWVGHWVGTWERELSLLDWNAPLLAWEDWVGNLLAKLLGIGLLLLL